MFGSGVWLSNKFVKRPATVKDPTEVDNAVAKLTSKQNKTNLMECHTELLSSVSSQ